MLGLVRAMRGGRLNDPRFHSRWRGEGHHAEQIHALFELARRKAGLVDRWVRYLAPMILGDGVGWPGGLGYDGSPNVFSLTRHMRVGDDLQVIHDRRNFADVLARVTL